MYRIIDKEGDYETFYEADTVEKVIELRNKSIKSEEVNATVTSCWPEPSQILHGKTFLGSGNEGVVGTLKSKSLATVDNAEKGIAYIPFTVDKFNPNKITLLTDESVYYYKNQIRS